MIETSARPLTPAEGRLLRATIRQGEVERTRKPRSWLLALPLSLGSIVVSNTTTGNGIPTSPYSAILDVAGSNPPTQSLPVNGNTTFSSLTAGSHTITIGGVDSNCQVAGGITQTVTVTAGQSTDVSYSITCELNPPAVTTGSASLVTQTGFRMNGTVNPNGLSTQAWYEYSTNSNMVGFATTAMQSVGSGTSSSAYAADLTGASSGTTYYYRIAGSNSVGTTRGSVLNVTTSSGGTARIIVRNNTTGTSIPSSPYTAILDVATSNPPAQSLPVNGELTFDGLAGGTHTMTIGGVDSNCAVSGGITRTVSPSDGGTSIITYQISCS